jgi:hypothetical protein
MSFNFAQAYQVAGAAELEQLDREALRDWMIQTRDIGGLMTMFIGPRGGGKTTAASWSIQYSKENFPNVRRVSNVPIENAVYMPDILKFLATKLIVEGGEKAYELKPDGTVHIVPRKTIPSKMLIIIDEAAISGFEARGSGMYSLNSYLLALSRKINVDIFLVSQLMSMVEKRGQWLADFYWLCEAIRDRITQMLEGFSYKIFDESFRPTVNYVMPRELFTPMLFDPPTFDTNDIPNYEQLEEAFRKSYNISDNDIQLYKDVQAGVLHEAPGASHDEMPHEETFLSRKALAGPRGRYPGETIIMDNKRYEILQRDYITEIGQYRYRVKEIPDTVMIQEPESKNEHLMDVVEAVMEIPEVDEVDYKRKEPEEDEENGPES